MSGSQQDRRRFTRIAFGAVVSLSQGTKTIETHLVDLSLNGVLVDTPKDYAFSTQEAIDIQIALSDDITITMHTRLAHNSSAFLGFECESIDMESIAHLRRLVELNLDDPEACERILDELLIRD